MRRRREGHKEMVVFSLVVQRDPLVTRFNASGMHHNGDHPALPQPGKGASVVIVSSTMPGAS